MPHLCVMFSSDCRVYEPQGSLYHFLDLMFGRLAATEAAIFFIDLF